MPLSGKRILFIALTLASGPAASQTTAWAPTKPVEMVVGVSPGGGIDRVARILQKIIQDRKLVETPVNVINKPGGGGTIAQAYPKEVERAGGVGHFMGSRELAAYFDKQYAEFHANLTDLGLAKVAVTK